METTLLTVEAAARRLCVSIKSVYKWVKAGKLKGVHLSRCVRVTEQSVIEMIERGRVAVYVTDGIKRPVPTRGQGKVKRFGQAKRRKSSK